MEWNPARRKRFDKGCNYVNKHRQGKFRNFRIVDLAAFSQFASVSELEKLVDVPQAVSKTLANYSPKSYFGDCIRYLRSLERPGAAFFGIFRLLLNTLLSTNN